jgi:threonine/homoserine/homoserine lactone efflux protein
MFFVKGLAIGFSIAAPVGPIGVLCIRRSLADGLWIGLVTGLGAATADAAFGCVAGFGLTAVSSFLVGQRFWLGLVGGLFLCWLGIRSFLAKPALQSPESRPAVAAGPAYISTLGLTLTNPMTILSFAAVFAGFGLGASTGYRQAGLLIGGVFLGSATWWLMLSGASAMLRSRVTPGWMQAVNRISGVVIVAFGAYALWTVTRR